MRRPSPFLWLLTVSLTLAACSGVPRILPSGSAGSPDIANRCDTFFPVAPYRFVHAVAFEGPDGSRSTALGVVLADPNRRMVHGVILTVEGLVLFDARYRRLLTVRRALPPFDTPGLAERVMADIRLVFSPPAGPPAETGILAGGVPVCRYRGEAGLTTDVLAEGNGGRDVRQYDEAGRLSRQIRIRGRSAGGVPEEIELIHHPFPRYRLRLTLLQAEPLTADDERLKD